MAADPEDDITIHSDPEEGWLQLTCGLVAFERLRRYIYSEIGPEFSLDIPPESIHDIQIECYRRPSPEEVTAANWYGNLAFLGIIALVLLLVVSMAVGFVEIAKMVWNGINTLLRPGQP